MANRSPNRQRFKTREEALTWLQTQRVKLTALDVEAFAPVGLRVIEAFAPVGLRVLGAIDYIGGRLVYANRELRVGDWQYPPRRAFLHHAHHAT